MLLAMLLALPTPEDFRPARERIVIYCRHDAKCIERQKREMAAFVKMMVAFSKGESNAGRCMRLGKRGHFIDWTVAAPCLRKAVKGSAIGT